MASFRAQSANARKATSHGPRWLHMIMACQCAMRSRSATSRPLVVHVAFSSGMRRSYYPLGVRTSQPDCWKPGPPLFARDCTLPRPIQRCPAWWAYLLAQAHRPGGEHWTGMLLSAGHRARSTNGRGVYECAFHQPSPLPRRHKFMTTALLALPPAQLAEVPTACGALRVASAVADTPAFVVSLCSRPSLNCR